MLSALVVRIGADLTGLDKGLARADRDVERFGRKIQPLGRSLTRIGNSASMAAGSLSRLGGVLPGVIGGTGALVASLGTASVVLGETALLTAGLTKGMRLLQSASTAVAASSAPAWLASLATPAGLAVAAIAAVAAAVAGLAFAWKKLKDSGPKTETFTLIDPFSRKMPFSEMTGDLAHTLEGVTASVTQLSGAAAEITIARDAIDAWQDALEGVRPVTDDITKRWKVAHDLIVTALQDQTKFTSGAVTELYRMLAALKEIEHAATALDRLPNFTLPRVGLTPGTHTPPEDGREVDYGISDRPSGMFGAVGRDGPRTDFAGRVGQVIQAGGGGSQMMQMVQAFASFGPMAALLPAINGALEALEPALTALLAPIVEIGRVIGSALAPIFEMLVPVLQLIADLLIRQFGPALKGITVVVSYVMEAFGWLVRGIGRLVDSLPGISAKGVINAGQAMIDAAESARRNAKAADGATDGLNKFASALSNIPRVLNVNALRHSVTGGSGAVPITRIGGPNGPPVVNNNGDIIINVSGSGDPEETANAVGRALERTRSRGGMGRLRLAVT